MLNVSQIRKVDLVVYIKLLNSFDQLIVIFRSTFNIIQKRNYFAVKLTLTNINNLFLVIKIYCLLINSLKKNYLN